MANYNFELCDFSGITGIVSSQFDLSIGQTVSFKIDEVGGLSFCATILSETEDVDGTVIINLYENCEKCFNDPCNTKTLTLKECENSENIFTVLSFNKFFPIGTFLQFSGSCYEVVSGNESSDLIPEFVVSLPEFMSCQDCNENKSDSRIFTSCFSDDGEINPGYRFYTNNTIQSGDSVSALINGFVFDCGIVGDTTTSGDTVDGVPHIVLQKIDNCEECGTLPITEAIVLQNCITGDEKLVIPDLNTFLFLQNNESGSISLGPDCYTFVELYTGDSCIYSFNSTSFDDYFDSCEICNQPISANTEYDGCLVCSGTTESVDLPHPTWTRTNGKAVIQLNAVELGGFNGLNS